IIPMQQKVRRTDEKPLNPLIMSIFPGKSGSVRVYEDEDNTNNYTQEAFAFTPVDFTYEANVYNIYIHAIEGEFPEMIQERSVELRLMNTFLPESVTWNGEQLAFDKYPDLHEEPCYYYEGSEMATIIRLPACSVFQAQQIIVKFKENQPQSLLNGAKGKVNWFKKVRKEMLAKYNEYQEYVPDILTDACQIAHRITVEPEKMQEELENLPKKLVHILDKIEEMTDENPVFEPALKLLKDLERQYFH
ncbi:MAG: DUF5110 domain-containing protein, partial [Verrucomicrobia bacterium]|nr:DUF5110 domain-containing protein [Cytophagales bacterium]